MSGAALANFQESRTPGIPTKQEPHNDRPLCSVQWHSEACRRPDRERHPITKQQTSARPKIYEREKMRSRLKLRM